MIERHLMKLRVNYLISDKEEQAIREAVSAVQICDANLTILQSGESLLHSVLLLDGLLGCYTDVVETRRQICQLHVPGDFADLRSPAANWPGQRWITMTSCHLAHVPRQRLQEVIEQFPHLAHVYAFSASLGSAINHKSGISTARRGTMERIAHFFCEMEARLDVVGLTEGPAYTLDLYQEELADCVGSHLVHVNRCLKGLRERGLVTFISRRVHIPDLTALRTFAAFDPRYLGLEFQRGLEIKTS